MFDFRWVSCHLLSFPRDCGDWRCPGNGASTDDAGGSKMRIDSFVKLRSMLFLKGKDCQHNHTGQSAQTRIDHAQTLITRTHRNPNSHRVVQTCTVPCPDTLVWLQPFARPQSIATDIRRADLDRPRRKPGQLACGRSCCPPGSITTAHRPNSKGRYPGCNLYGCGACSARGSASANRFDAAWTRAGSPHTLCRIPANFVASGRIGE